MPFYAYQATDEQGHIVDGRMEAKSTDAVVARLQQLSFYPLEVRLTEEVAETRKIPLFGFRRAKNVAFFTSQLATLLESGLPLDRSLAIAEELTDNEAFGAIVGQVRTSVEEGSTLANALGEHPSYFDNLYVSMVRAGESGGVLEIVLRRLADFLEESQRMKDFIVSVLAYPLFLVLFSMVALIAIFTLVLPRFSRIFSEMGTAVPLPAQVLMAISAFIGAWWWAMLLAVALIVFALRSWLVTVDGRLWIDRRRLEWPLIGGLTSKLEAARFARTMGTLLTAGVPVLQAVDIVGETVNNSFLASFMPAIRDGLKRGEGLVKPLRATKAFPALFIHMATVGEETGHLEEMLVKTATIYEREVESATKGLLSLLEPVILVVLGVVLGSIILSVLYSVFSVYSSSF